MSRECFDLATFETFRRAGLSPAETRALVRQLLTRAAGDVAVEGGQWPFRRGEGPDGESPAAEGGSRYGEVLDRVFAAVGSRQTQLADEQAQVPRLLSELLDHPPERRRVLVRNSRRFQTWALCEALLEQCHEWGFKEPRKAVELAELAILVAERLESPYVSEALLNDLKARAWACLANARRISGEIRAADKDFRVAESFVEKGTGDLLEKARILYMKASLRGDQRRYDEAQRLLDRVVSIYHRAGERHLLGESVLKKGLFHGYAGQSEEGIQYLRQALQLIDPQQDPRLVLATRHNLILFLNESERSEEALALLEETRPLYKQFGDPINLLRLRWLEGRIAVELGRFEAAEGAFQEVRAEFTRRGMGCDAALVSLDLAGICARQGRIQGLRRLAEEMLPIFQSTDLHREAIAALLVFRRSAQLEQVTLGLIRELSDYLERSRNNPKLQFRRSG